MSGEIPRVGPPSPAERYVVVDLGVLEAIKELANINQHAWRALPGIRLTLRVVRIDPVTNNLVIAVNVARDLEEPPLVTRPHDWPHDQ